MADKRLTAYNRSDKTNKTCAVYNNLAAGLVLRKRAVGGAEGDRTPDLCNAIAALSQLSYGPTCLPPLSETSHARKGEIAGGYRSGSAAGPPPEN